MSFDTGSFFCVVVIFAVSRIPLSVVETNTLKKNVFGSWLLQIRPRDISGSFRVREFVTILVSAAALNRLIENSAQESIGFLVAALFIQWWQGDSDQDISSRIDFLKKYEFCLIHLVMVLIAAYPFFVISQEYSGYLVLTENFWGFGTLAFVSLWFAISLLVSGTLPQGSLAAAFLAFLLFLFQLALLYGAGAKEKSWLMMSLGAVVLQLLGCSLMRLFARNHHVSKRAMAYGFYLPLFSCVSLFCLLIQGIILWLR